MPSGKNRLSKVLMVSTCIGTLAVIYLQIQRRTSLPVMGPSDFNPALVELKRGQKYMPHQVSDFELINQNGEIITQSDYKDKIYVTDFFFTRCPSICPVMANNMEELQQAFMENHDVMFLSISVTPEMDSVPILKEYALRNGVLDSKWNVTTGNKKHIYELARKSYFAAMDYGDGGLQDFIHTTNFTLVDKRKQIRGVYDGTDSKDIVRLIKDIKKLSR